MSFTVDDFNEFKRLLAENPQWCIELRDLLLRDDLESLRGLVREMIETQRRADQRMAETWEALRELVQTQLRSDQRIAQLQISMDQRFAEAQQRTDQKFAEAQERTDQKFAEVAEQLDRTDQRLTDLAESHARTDQRLADLAESHARTDQRLADLAESHARTDQRVAELVETQREFGIRQGHVDGRSLEQAYRHKAPAYFGRWLRRAHVVDTNEVVERVEDQLTTDQVFQLLQTDLFVGGRIRQHPAKPEVWLVVEISCVVDRHDVERAVKRAELLRRCGLPAVPVVAGEESTEGAAAEAQRLGVAMLQDGTGRLWDEALAAWPV